MYIKWLRKANQISQTMSGENYLIFRISWFSWVDMRSNILKLCENGEEFLSMAKQGDIVLGSIHLFVCLRALSWLNRFTFDLAFWHGGLPWPGIGWDCWSRSNSKKRVLASLLPCFKVKGQGHGVGQRSRSNFWRAAVNIRGSALRSVAKSNKSHYQSKVSVSSVCNQWANEFRMGSFACYHQEHWWYDVWTQLLIINLSF